MVAGTVVFTGERSHVGYRLNKLASSLTDPENRKAFLADEAAYMARFALDAAEQELVRRRDWGAMINHGASVYLILKIAGTVGQSLMQMGAQMRGQTADAFMAEVANRRKS